MDSDSTSLESLHLKNIFPFPPRLREFGEWVFRLRSKPPVVLENGVTVHVLFSRCISILSSLEMLLKEGTLEVHRAGHSCSNMCIMLFMFSRRGCTRGVETKQFHPEKHCWHLLSLPLNVCFMCPPWDEGQSARCGWSIGRGRWLFENGFHLVT